MFLSLLSPLSWFTNKGRLSRAQFWIWLAAWGLMVYLLYAVSYWLSWSGIIVAALLLFWRNIPHYLLDKSLWIIFVLH